jgi:8-oxo-dGTP pyrophosphatase MutT (NUDIX family)
MSDDQPYSDPIPAATLVIFRDGPDAPELLMIERARAMAFAGGALVFPGGRIDPADELMSAAYTGDRDDIVARIAAIRETIEEAGLPVGLNPIPDAATLAAIRRGLHDGQPLGGLLETYALRLDLDGLVPFARWCPRHRNMRIFDTIFFLARLPEGSPDPVVDATENTRVFWRTAQGVLDDADAGRVRIIFPTRRNLERLAQFGSFAEAVAHARAHPIRTVTPWIEQRGGHDHLCIPDDLGYPITSEALQNAMRG